MPSLKAVASNTIRIARLKLLFIAAKVVKDQDKVKYSIHDARTPAPLSLFGSTDETEAVAAGGIRLLLAGIVMQNNSCTKLFFKDGRLNESLDATCFRKSRCDKIEEKSSLF